MKYLIFSTANRKVNAGSISPSMLSGLALRGSFNGHLIGIGHCTVSIGSVLTKIGAMAKSSPSSPFFVSPSSSFASPFCLALAAIFTLALRVARVGTSREGNVGERKYKSVSITERVKKFSMFVCKAFSVRFRNARLASVRCCSIFLDFSVRPIAALPRIFLMSRTLLEAKVSSSSASNFFAVSVCARVRMTKCDASMYTPSVDTRLSRSL